MPCRSPATGNVTRECCGITSTNMQCTTSLYGSWLPINTAGCVNTQIQQLISLLPTISSNTSTVSGSNADNGTRTGNSTLTTTTTTTTPEQIITALASIVNSSSGTLGSADVALGAQLLGTALDTLVNSLPPITTTPISGKTSTDTAKQTSIPPSVATSVISIADQLISVQQQQQQLQQPTDDEAGTETGATPASNTSSSATAAAAAAAAAAKLPILLESVLTRVNVSKDSELSIVGSNMIATVVDLSTLINTTTVNANRNPAISKNTAAYTWPPAAWTNSSSGSGSNSNSNSNTNINNTSVDLSLVQLSLPLSALNDLSATRASVTVFANARLFTNVQDSVVVSPVISAKVLTNTTQTTTALTSNVTFSLGLATTSEARQSLRTQIPSLTNKTVRNFRVEQWDLLTVAVCEVLVPATSAWVQTAYVLDPTCVWWDSETTSWSSEGCTRLPIVPGSRSVPCTCSHLTNFAILVNVKASENTAPITSTEGRALQAATYASCAIALLCMLLVIVTFTVIAPDLRKLKQLILLHLCVALAW